MDGSYNFKLCPKQATDGTAIALINENKQMKKILLGALVAAAAAGVVFYLTNPEKFKEVVDDLKDKADDALSKVKDTWEKSEQDYRGTTT